MRAVSAVRLPVLIGFPEASGRAEGWGRFSELSGSSAALSTLTRLSSRERVHLSFELAGERFESLAADVVVASLDADGYCVAEVSFRDEVQRRRLAKALLDVLSRS